MGVKVIVTDSIPLFDSFLLFLPAYPSTESHHQDGKEAVLKDESNDTEKDEQDQTPHLRKRKPSSGAVYAPRRKASLAKSPSPDYQDEDSDDEPVVASKRVKFSGSPRASGSERRTSVASRKAGSSSKPSRSTDNPDDQARAQALKVLTGVLEGIFSNPALRSAGSPSGTINPAAVDDTKSSAERANEYAAAFEEELFVLSESTVAQKYRDRFRTFLFSLKDKKNDGLHSRIVSGQLDPKALAHLSNDQLANDAIREATEKARQDALHRSTLKQQSGPLRKMTHKGEVEIEYDDSTSRSTSTLDRPKKKLPESDTMVLDASDSVRAQLPDGQPASPFKQPPPPSPGKDRISASEPTVSPTMLQQPSASPGKDVGPATCRSPSAERARSLSTTLTMASPTASKFDFSSVWKPEESAPSEQTSGQDEDAKEDSEAFEHSGVFEHDFLEDGGEGDEAGQAADDFIDSFLGSHAEDTPAEEAETDTDLGPRSKDSKRPSTPEAEPPSELMHRFRPVMWAGTMNLPDVGTFSGSIRQVAGRSLVPDPWVWSYFFPAPHSVIEGRLPSNSATDYLLQVMNSPRTQIVVFALEADSGTDSEAYQNEFVRMLDHFQSKGRWGVLHKSTRAKGTILKDIYLVPLRKTDAIPVWLDMIETDALGQAWSNQRDRDLFLIPAVILRDSIEAEATRNQEREARASVSNATPVPPPPATASTTVADSTTDNVKISTQALQDLLRSIGRSSNSMASPNPGVPASSPIPPSGWGADARPPMPGPPPRPPPSMLSTGGASPYAPGGASPYAPAPGGASPGPMQWTPPPPAPSGPHAGAYYDQGAGVGTGWQQYGSPPPGAELAGGGYGAAAYHPGPPPVRPGYEGVPTGPRGAGGPRGRGGRPGWGGGGGGSRGRPY